MKSQLVVALLLLTALAALGGAPAAAKPPATASTIAVQLREQNGSRQAGTATVTIVPRKGSVGAHFVVTLKVTPASGKFGAAAHAHIHNVSCARFAAMTDASKQLATIAMPLTDLVDGTSSTTIYLSPARYVNGASSINVHASNGTYTVVACGDLPKRSARDTRSNRLG